MQLAAYESYQAAANQYTGAMATFDVYGFPNLTKGESSSAQIWVINKGNGESDNVNKIMSGWEVRNNIIITLTYVITISSKKLTNFHNKSIQTSMAIAKHIFSYFGRYCTNFAPCLLQCVRLICV